MKIAIGLVASALLLTGCSARAATDCTAERRIDLTPNEVTLIVGEQVQLTIRLTTCGGSKVVRDDITWGSRNHDVATVDAVSGMLRAIAVGQTQIVVTGRTYGELGHVPVMVTNGRS